MPFERNRQRKIDAGESRSIDLKFELWRFLWWRSYWVCSPPLRCTSYENPASLGGKIVRDDEQLTYNPNNPQNLAIPFPRVLYLQKRITNLPFLPLPSPILCLPPLSHHGGTSLELEIAKTNPRLILLFLQDPSNKVSDYDV
ncbi:hypothetical protein H5410_027652 [Solanum commersonii]|uniref:Uncharacterized protein n=1 Tax=Solanum commersonii TaxID=4109 RepID=A0A9J5Z2I1_SOLCO|nr:hypothetical protein H5410_027652 [Solanum commersonii]